MKKIKLNNIFTTQSTKKFFQSLASSNLFFSRFSSIINKLTRKMLILGDIVSYYFKNKYRFSDHGLLRIKNRLNLKDKTDIDIINYCSNLIDSSHEIHETKTYKYVKVNQTNLYFVVDKISNLIITLSPIKPEKMLANLENNL